MVGQGKRLRVLLCAPADSVAGGIPAVVAGLLEGFKASCRDVTIHRVLYARPKRNISSGLRILAELRQTANFVVQLLRYNPGIVHIQTSFDKKTVIRDSLHLWITMLLGKKMVLHAHGGSWDSIPSWPLIWQAYTRAFLGNCHVIIVTSSDELAIIRGLLPNRPNIHNINNPILLPENIATGSRGRGAGKKIVTFASRLIPTKGILDVLDCAAVLERNDYLIKLYGDGELREEVTERIRVKKLSDRVELVGEVPFRDLIIQYAKSDVYLFPSYHLEGFPMALFYAAACSAAIICTKVRPLPDFFKEPDNCLWVDPRNPAMLADKLAMLLDDERMRRRMSINNAAVSKRFDPGTVASEITEVYRQTLHWPPATDGTGNQALPRMKHTEQ